MTFTPKELSAIRECDALESVIDRMGQAVKRIDARADFLRRELEALTEKYERRIDALDDLSSTVSGWKFTEEEKLWALEEQIDAGVLFEEGVS